jgi:hypothetical protein
LQCIELELRLTHEVFSLIGAYTAPLVVKVFIDLPNPPFHIRCGLVWCGYGDVVLQAVVPGFYVVKSGIDISFRSEDPP